MNYITKHCLLCGEKEDLVVLYPRTFRDEDLTPAVFSARRTTEHFHYTICRCRNCGQVFSREILPDEELARLYADSAVTFGEYTDIIRADYWRCLEPYMSGQERGAALEIGCSTGFFLEELRARGFREVAGCEPSTEARQLAHPSVRDSITTGFFRDGLYPEATFDLVCSFQTLDHLSDPRAIVKECFRILKPGGLAYFITHNAGSLQARVLGERSPIIDVEHIYLFDKHTLPALLTQLNFTMVAVGDVKNSYPLDYWIRMFPLPQTYRNAARWLAKSVHIGGLPVPLKAGNMFVIGRRPG